MIPTIEDILEGLLDGTYLLDKAVMLVDQHIEHAGLRDHFAGLAMPAHMQALSSMQTDPGKWHEVIANLSYKTADAMLEARKCEP